MRYEYFTPEKKYHNEDDPPIFWFPELVDEKDSYEYEEYEEDEDE